MRRIRPGTRPRALRRGRRLPLLVARDLCGPDDKLVLVFESGGIVPATASGEDVCKLGNAMARHLQVGWTVDRPLKVGLTFSGDATATVDTEPLLSVHHQPKPNLHPQDTGVNTGIQPDMTSSEA